MKIKRIKIRINYTPKFKVIQKNINFDLFQPYYRRSELSHCYLTITH